jgi:hypothetical protein
VIAAADWIYKNKDTYDIRVANFSLTGSVDSSFLYDRSARRSRSSGSAASSS